MIVGLAMQGYRMFRIRLVNGETTYEIQNKETKGEWVEVSRQTYMDALETEKLGNAHDIHTEVNRLANRGES